MPSPEGKVQRVPLDEPRSNDAHVARDTTALRLNHALHLKRGLRGKDGPTTLQCSSCHQSGDRPGVMAPVNFERHCQDCHTLGFDERLSQVQVPHGAAAEVYPFLFAQYANLLLPRAGADTDWSKRSGNGGYEIPKGGALADTKEQRRLITQVTQHARTAERELFTKTGCVLCHDVSKRNSGGDDADSLTTVYEVKEPRMPKVWFPAAHFSHKPHEEVTCESCHTGVTKSSKSSDVLMPRVAVCKECHTQEPKVGFVASGCVMCHGYHDAKPLPTEKKQAISDYLFSLTTRERR